MERRNAIALTFLRPQLTPLQLIQIYEAVGSATEVIENLGNLQDIVPDINVSMVENLAKSLSSALKRADEEIEFCDKHQIQVLIPSDDEYPYRLRNCDDAPLVLYYRGSISLNASHVVCIIGTRKCTTYGQDLIRRFVADLKSMCPDVVIVSGLAYGVDIHAHRNALANGLDTIGVVAHGLDMIYPKMHRETATQMVSHGGILTEYPIRSFIDKRNFLQRNRIVAGISDACVLPESAIHGGGLVTCRLSNDYGRQVFAFPGAIGAEYSEGCNQLIRRQGAQLITCARDFIEEMGWDADMQLEKKKSRGIERTLFPDLTPDQQKLVAALQENGDMSVDQLVDKTGLTVSTASSSLFMLEMSGVVSQQAGGVYHLLD